MAYYADIALPLTDLTKNKVLQHIEWTETQQYAFDKLKLLICYPPVLRTPDWTRPFILRADASMYATGTSSSQEFVSNNNNIEEHPIANASCKFSETQLKWSIIEKEAYDVLFGFQSYDYFLFGSKVFVYTDHNPLQYITQNAPNNARLTRWMLALQRYNFVINHVKGQDNKVCDALSRLDNSEI